MAWDMASPTVEVGWRDFWQGEGDTTSHSKPSTSSRAQTGAMGPDGSAHRGSGGACGHSTQVLAPPRPDSCHAEASAASIPALEKPFPSVSRGGCGRAFVDGQEAVAFDNRAPCDGPDRRPGTSQLPR